MSALSVHTEHAKQSITLVLEYRCHSTFNFFFFYTKTLQERRAIEAKRPQKELSLSYSAPDIQGRL